MGNGVAAPLQALNRDAAAEAYASTRQLDDLDLLLSERAQARTVEHGELFFLANLFALHRFQPHPDYHEHDQYLLALEDPLLDDVQPFRKLDETAIQ